MSDSRPASPLLAQQTSPEAGLASHRNGTGSAGQEEDPSCTRAGLERDVPVFEPAVPPPLPGKTQRETRAARRMSSAEPLSPRQDRGAGGSPWHSPPGHLIYSNIGEMRAHLAPAKMSRGESSATASADQLPPPLPKKQLSRARSLPEMQVCPFSPCQGGPFPTPPGVHHTLPEGATPDRGGRRYSESAERPLGNPRRYLPTSQSRGDSEPWGTRGKTPPGGGPGPVPAHPTFATPDGELLSFFQALESTATVQEKVMGCHQAALVRLTARTQAILGGEEERQLVGAELAGKKWADFTLLETEPCCETGEAWYYRVCCASEPRRPVLAAKVHKSCPRSLSVQMSVGAHFNIQQVLGHFIDSPPKDLVPGARPEKLGQLRPGEDEGAVSAGASPPLTQVALSPEVPYQTLADFVRGSHALHSSWPGPYERLACLLLLQLCTGLEHLKQQRVAGADVHMENLLLVQCPSPPRGRRDETPATALPLPRLVVSDFSKATGQKKSASVARDPDRGSTAPTWLSVARVQSTEGLQLGKLVYKILHLPDPLQKASGLRSGDLPAIPARSTYSRGLQTLASLLLHPDPRRSLPVEQAKAVLQILLWGPRQELFPSNQLTSVLLRNWVAIKRMLLLLSFAEKAPEATASVGLEEWLCCCYFTETSAHTLLRTLRTLHASDSLGVC